MHRHLRHPLSTLTAVLAVSMLLASAPMAFGVADQDIVDTAMKRQ